MITTKEVEHVAKLARLALTDEEKEKYTEQFSSILKYFDQLSEVNTENVEPMVHVLPVRNVLREDKVEVSVDREEILKNAPSEENGYFRVPKI